MVEFLFQIRFNFKGSKSLIKIEIFQVFFNEICFFFFKILGSFFWFGENFRNFLALCVHSEGGWLILSLLWIDLVTV